MRRPTLCGDVHTVDREADDVVYLHGGGTASDRDGRGRGGGGQGRLSRVKRLIADSLLLGSRRGAAVGAGAGAGAGPGAGASPASSSACPRGPKGSKQFGIPLRDVALTKEGVPVVVAKICSYLDNYGLQCEGLFQNSAANPRLADRLRNSLDLESANDVFTTALLLKLWLKELPEPIVWGHVASELLSTHEKVSKESVGTWRQAIRLVLCTLPETNLRLLRYILRFLHRYNHHQQQRSSKSGAQATLSRLGTVFAPLLILRGLEYYGADQLSKANLLTSRLIQDHASIFHQWLLDHPSDVSSNSKSSPNTRKKNHHGGSMRKHMEDAENSSQHRKRKERNESSNSNQSLERKVIRSNSAERHVELTIADNKNENIRRVSSHEDFSHVRQQKIKASTINRNRFTTVVELSDQPQTVHFSGLPLQECNHIDPPLPSKDIHSSTQISQDICSLQKENELHKEQQQSLKVRDRYHAEYTEDEHEKRRSSERFSRSLVPPRSVARRNIGRKKRVHQSCSTAVKPSDVLVKEKDNDELLQNVPQTTVTQHLPDLTNQHSLSSEEQDEDGEPEAEVESLSDESRPGSSHSFLQLHPPERERSPSPSVSPCTPPLDLTTLHQSVDSSEPVASRVGWDFVRPQHQEEEAGRGILLSPRNSMILSRRVFMDHNIPPSPPGDHHGSCLLNPAIDLENLIQKLNKQVTSIKKKLKRYEEGFEKEFGYRPSQSDKMANKDIKKLCLELSRIRKELKQIKENPLSAMASQSDTSALRVIPSGNLTGTSSIEDTVAEVERHLKEKRRIAGRPESLDEMTAEQNADEKLTMQKALLLLEKICGRATSKQDREIVRPLYDRYRLLKRTVARATSSKLKDSINELETIHEHEAMDFTPSTSLPAMPDSSMDTALISTIPGCTVSIVSSPTAGTAGASGSTVPQTQPSIEETSDSQTSSSDSLGENLHALPLSDLVLQLTQTREEKKKLRRLLREQEDQFLHHTGRRMQREDRTDAAAAKDYTNIYSSYKQVKAKLRLLEALVAKQR